MVLPQSSPPPPPPSLPSLRIYPSFLLTCGQVYMGCALRSNLMSGRAKQSHIYFLFEPRAMLFVCGWPFMPSFTLFLLHNTRILAASPFGVLLRPLWPGFIAPETTLSDIIYSHDIAGFSDLATHLRGHPARALIHAFRMDRARPAYILFFALLRVCKTMRG